MAEKIKPTFTFFLLLLLPASVAQGCGLSEYDNGTDCIDCNQSMPHCIACPDETQCTTCDVGFDGGLC